MHSEFSDAGFLNPTADRLRWKHRGLILLLLISVPVLATIARNSWYLSPSNPGHYLITAAKMETSHAAPVLFDGQVLEPVVRIEAARPRVRFMRRIEPERALPSIGVTISLRHRSPPGPFTA